jgi:ABC-type nitrate/sulfonate/bicarbonate transport system permease component
VNARFIRRRPARGGLEAIARARSKSVAFEVQAFSIAMLIALAFWQLATFISDGWVPSLPRILEAFLDDLRNPVVYESIWITFRRILITFAASTLVGVFLGVGMALSKHVEALIRPVVVIGLAIPDPVYVIIAILVLGTEESSGLVAMTIALIPFVVNIVVAGVHARDLGLDEMSAVYRFGARRYLVEVVGRQITPALLAAARTSFAFSWKLVVLVEALSQPEGIGAQIYYAFRLLRPAEMIALALIFVLLMRAIDVLVFERLERRALAWR